MSTIDTERPLDEERLMAFVFRAVEEVGATLNSALVVMGDKLGLYRALAGAGALTAGQLADKTGVAERYVREWCNAQAAGGFIEYDPDGGRYSLAPEQTVALTDSDSPAFLPGFFQIAVGSCSIRHASPRRRSAAPASAGTSTATTCSTDANDSSVRVTTPTSSRAGCRHSMASSTRSSAAPRSPTSAAVTGPRRS